MDDSTPMDESGAMHDEGSMNEAHDDRSEHEAADETHHEGDASEAAEGSHDEGDHEAHDEHAGEGDDSPAHEPWDAPFGDTPFERSEWIIHGASAAAAGAAAISPIPGSDAIAIMPIQIAMVAGIARQYDLDVSTALVRSTIYASLTTITGRASAGLLMRWVPVAGNVVRAGVAAGVTQALGRMILDRLEAGKGLP